MLRLRACRSDQDPLGSTSGLLDAGDHEPDEQGERGREQGPLRLPQGRLEYPAIEQVQERRDQGPDQRRDIAEGRHQG